MTGETQLSGAGRNIRLYPWYRFLRSLVFWQAIWFLYFQDTLSAAEAILLYVIYDIATTALEVPSGYMSDRLGRRFTLIASAIAGLSGTFLLATGKSFETFAIAQVLLGASAAFASGTDSALLYESLAAEDQRDEIERHELRAWRFSFSALALSAVTGGLMAGQIATLPFFAGALAWGGVLLISLRFTESPHVASGIAQGGEILRLRSLGSALTNPVLAWLFCLGMLMYVFSHIPFVFGQPFILESLARTGFQTGAPLVSGAVTAIMMIVSLGTSLVAQQLRRAISLPGILLLAFGMQIALSAMLALSNETIVIALLFLRMVPDSLSGPFILARIQPLLGDESRATYLSLRSLCGRLVFATTLYFVASGTTDAGQMPYPEIQQILGWYVIAGTICLGLLILSASRLRIDAEPNA